MAKPRKSPPTLRVWVLERVFLDSEDAKRPATVGVFPTAEDAKKRWRNSACKWRRVPGFGWQLTVNGVRLFWLHEQEVRP